MFDHIGEKIKGLARIVCWAGIVVSVIYGLVVMFSQSFFGGLLIAALGAVGSWTGSFVMYGFGELVESAVVLRDAELSRQQQQADAQPVVRRRSETQSSGYSLTRLANQQRSSGGSWLCAKCGRKNSDTSPVCGDCGSSRKDAASAVQPAGYSLTRLAQQSENSVVGGWQCKNAVSGTALPLCSAPIAVPASKAHVLKGWALRRENITARKQSIVCAAVSLIPLRRFFVRFFRLIGIENILQTCYIGCMKIIVFFAGRP